MSNSTSRLIIFDTTLRDGEQSPGVTLSVSEKVEIAQSLLLLGVDVCEAGFPMASQGDFDAVYAIAKQVGDKMTVCALARATENDIKRAFEALKPATKKRIHTFLATSDIHLEHKLKITRQQCIEKSINAVRYAKSLGCDDIQFSPEDAGRSDRQFLVQVLDAVIEAGATTINIPDTVGYNTPQEFGDLIKYLQHSNKRYLVTNVKNASQVTISTHCHNDLGLATANTLSGVLNGARQVEVTINGIGERAGNTALEEIIMSIYVHPNTFKVFHNINTKLIYGISALVSKRTGMIVQPNKAIVGKNAFAHESGIHQDGYLKHHSTYEIISPEVIGIPDNHKIIVLGKHSGRHALQSRLKILINSNRIPKTYEKILSEKTNFELLFESFKRVADSKKTGVNDDDLIIIVDELLQTIIEHVDVVEGGGGRNMRYVLKQLQVFTGLNCTTPTATVTILDSHTPLSSSSSSEETGSEKNYKQITDCGVGSGGVEAIFNAINRVLDVGVGVGVETYRVESVGCGGDSLATATIRVNGNVKIENFKDVNVKIENAEPQNEIEMDIKKEIICNNGKITVVGVGSDEDVMVASAKAYLNAINKLMGNEHERNGNGCRNVEI